MAIIYSYQENLELLNSDRLVGTATTLHNGQSRKVTKNFSLGQLKQFINGPELELTTLGTSGAADLDGSVLNIPVYQGQITLTTTGTSGAATFVNNVLNIPQYGGTPPTPTLNQVLTAGNTSEVNAYVGGELGLYDIANLNYSTLNAFDNTFTFNNSDGEPVLYFEQSALAISKSTTIAGTIYTTGLSASRNYNLPDASGTIALTSDIPSLAGYVQTTRTLTINGTTYDLSANRTWNVGTVTNVTATGQITSTGGTTPVISTLMHTDRLIGRTTAGTGVMEEISVGAGLTLSAGTLSATASGSYVPYTGATGNVDLGIYTLLSGHFLTGPTASANFTRFPNALAAISNVPSGVQQNESLYIGLMSEGLSVGSTWASGVYGAGYTNSSGSGRGTGVTGEGHVSAATDTGVAVGVRGYAKDTHTGNYNIGLYGDAENGDTGLTYGGNVSLFLANGNIVTSSAAAKTWYLGGNITFDGQGSSKVIGVINGASFALGTVTSGIWNATAITDSYIASAAAWNAKFTLPSLTSGSVLFSNGTTIAQDNANFFWNDSTNRLGIGTNSPSAALHVNGNMYLQNAATAVESIYFSSGPLINNDGPAGIFRSGEVYTDTINGYVGIGNGTPSTALDVIGVITATGGTSTSWNAKQDAITLTTTGTSGPATLVGATLNIPQYSGGGVSGLQGIHALIELSSGSQISSITGGSTGGTGGNFVANRLLAYPFIPNKSFTSSNLQINVATPAASSLARIAVYTDLNGAPDTSIFISSDLDCSTSGLKTATASISFVAGTTYWLAFHGSATVSGVNLLLVAQMVPLKYLNTNTAANYLYRAVTFTSGTPTTFGAPPTYFGGNAPLIFITKA